MPLSRLPPWAFTLIAVAPGLILVAADFAFSFSSGAPALRVAVITAILVWALAFSLIGWRRLDEPGRAAHKVAWLHGGGCGLFAALTGVMVVHFVPAAGALYDGISASWAPKWPESQGGFALGVLFAAMMQVIGYFFAWAAWWIRRR